MKERILIIENDSSMQKIVLNALKSIDSTYVTVQVSDSETALEQLRMGGFQLVISSYDLQPKSGLDIFNHTRTDNGSTGIPFIMMIPANNNKEKLMAMAKAGLLNYITKPVNTSSLKSAMERALPR
ncbi:MAG: response regulator [Saprospiraceae bacterium]|nr:response regulator [Saprospiraceae bacterium]